MINTPLSRISVMMFVTVALLGLAGWSQAVAASAANFYVAPDGNDAWSGALAAPNADKTDGPLKTLLAARDAGRKRRASLPDQAVTICLREGTYFLDAPLTLSPEDSGTKDAPLIFTAMAGEKPVISGGRPITGWKDAGAGRWTVAVSGVKEGTWQFEQLFVNGERRFRPRLPKGNDLYRIASLAGVDPKIKYTTPMDRFEFHGNDLKDSWTNLQDVEVVVYHFWVDAHLPISRIDSASHVVSFAKKSHRRLTADDAGAPASYYVDNVFEALDTPGQWYLDRPSGVLTYLPKPGEDMTQVQVVAPALKYLVRIDGDAAHDKYVQHVHFKGLTFSHSQSLLSKTDAGDDLGASSMPGALYLQGSRNCNIGGCTFKGLGTFGIEVSYGCRDIHVEGNAFYDVGGGAIKAGGGDLASPPHRQTGGNSFTQNEIHDLGQVQHCATAVLLMHTADNVVAHNHIHHTDYSGISVGWVFGYGPSISRNNRVEYNLIHDIGRGTLSDIGAIYLLGVQPDTVINNNVIHDVQGAAYGGWGIYTDEGSSDMLIENNIVYRARSGAFEQHFGRNNMIRNNIFALGRDGQVVRAQNEPESSFTIERNIMYANNAPMLAKNWTDNHFKIDYNVYFDVSSRPLTFGKVDFAQWRKLGHDVHSVVADPQFYDPDKGDFRLKPTSPALKLGFKPIDASQAGITLK